MTIKAKILGLVCAFACLALAIMALGLKTMNDYTAVIDTYRQTADNALRGERLNRYMSEAALEMRGIYMSQTEDETRFFADRADAAADHLSGFITDWKAHLRPGELPQFGMVFDKAGKLASGGHFIAKYSREHGHAAANAIGNTPEHRIFREQMQSQIDTMIAGINAAQAQSQARLVKFERQRQQEFLIVAGSGIALLLAASMWIAIGAITRPLGRVRQSMVDISEGAYETPIPEGNGGEIGQLWHALDILKNRAIEARRLSEDEIARQQKLRELVLD